MAHKIPGGLETELSRYVYDGKQPPRVDADGLPVPVETVKLDFGKGEEIAVLADGVVFLTTIKGP